MLQVCLIVMCLFLLMRKPTQVYPVSKQKVIEKRIEGKETVIKEQGKVIDNSKSIIAELNHGLFDLQAQLDGVKNARDTFNIVQIQDTMIHVLYKRDKEKDAIIAAQDTIIQAQRYIINAKDTIIATKDFDLKRIKRQRNISILLNGLLTTGLIIK
jgi:hypothetical protein